MYRNKTVHLQEYCGWWNGKGGTEWGKGKGCRGEGWRGEDVKRGKNIQERKLKEIDCIFLS